MIGIALVTLWTLLVVGYLLRQQLRGELSQHERALPPLPWRGEAISATRGIQWRDRAA